MKHEEDIIVTDLSPVERLVVSRDISTTSNSGELLSMNKGVFFIPAVAIGAGLMYFFDARQGRRRRIVFHDRSLHLWRASTKLLSKASRDFNHRLQGMRFRIRSKFNRNTNAPVIDNVLVQRIRSKFGRLVAHPHSVDVECNNGQVVLSGSIASHEFDPLLACVARVPGVKGVETRLQVFERPHDQIELENLNQSFARHSFGEVIQSPRVISHLITGTLLTGGALSIYRRRFGMSALCVGGLFWFARGIEFGHRARSLKKLKPLFWNRHGARAMDLTDSFTLARMTHH